MIDILSFLNEIKFKNTIVLYVVLNIHTTCDELR